MSTSLPFEKKELPVLIEECAGLVHAWRRGLPLPKLSRGASVYGSFEDLGGLFSALDVKGDSQSRQKWLATWQANAQRNWSFFRFLGRFWPVDLPAPLLFKGGAFTLELYRDWGARQVSDLDLMIPSPWFQRAARSLALQLTSSYAQSLTEGEKRPHQIAFSGEGGLLELHHSPTPWGRFPFSTERIWRQSTVLSEGPMISPLEAMSPALTHLRLPSPLDALLLWLGNCAKGGAMSRWVELIDLLLLIERIDPGPALERAIDRAELTPVWRLSLWQLSELGLRPTRWMRTPAPTLSMRWLTTSPRTPTSPQSPQRSRDPLAKFFLLSTRGKIDFSLRMARELLSSRRSSSERCSSAL